MIAPQIDSNSWEKVLYLDFVDDSFIEKKAIGLYCEFTFCLMTAFRAMLDTSMIGRIFVSRSLSMYDTFVKLASVDFIAWFENNAYAFFFCM